MFKVRSSYLSRRRSIVAIQCLWRQKLAKRELRRFKKVRMSCICVIWFCHLDVIHANEWCIRVLFSSIWLQLPCPACSDLSFLMLKDLGRCSIVPSMLVCIRSNLVLDAAFLEFSRINTLNSLVVFSGRRLSSSGSLYYT